MGQQLRTLAVLLEDWGSIPTIHMVAHNFMASLSSVLEDLTPSSGLYGQCTHIVRRHTSKWNIDTHEIKIKKEKNLFSVSTHDIHVEVEECKQFVHSCVPVIELRFGGKYSYPLNHFTGSKFAFREFYMLCSAHQLLFSPSFPHKSFSHSCLYMWPWFWSSPLDRMDSAEPTQLKTVIWSSPRICQKAVVQR